MQQKGLLLEIAEWNHTNELLKFKKGLELECSDWRIADWTIADEKETSDNQRRCFLITDTIDSVKLARQKGIGYAVYLNEKSRRESFPDALYCIEDLSVITSREITHMYERAAGLPWTILETERCLIREQKLSDLDALYQIYENKELSTYTEDLFENRQEEEAYLRDYIENQYRFYEYGIWAIIRKADGKLIGRAGISNRPGFDEAELGYIIAKEEQRKGYAYEVLRAITEYAAEELSMDSLQAFTRKENLASRSLLKKLGFERFDSVVLENLLYERYIKRNLK